MDRMPVEGIAERLPLKTILSDYIGLWNWDGTLERIHRALYTAVREQLRR
jgi:hypothetical protein